MIKFTCSYYLLLNHALAIILFSCEVSVYTAIIFYIRLPLMCDDERRLWLFFTHDSFLLEYFFFLLINIFIIIIIIIIIIIPRILAMNILIPHWSSLSNLWRIIIWIWWENWILRNRADILLLRLLATNILFLTSFFLVAKVNHLWDIIIHTMIALILSITFLKLGNRMRKQWLRLKFCSWCSSFYSVLTWITFQHRTFSFESFNFRSVLSLLNLLIIDCIVIRIWLTEGVRTFANLALKQVIIGLISEGKVMLMLEGNFRWYFVMMIGGTIFDVIDVSNRLCNAIKVVCYCCWRECSLLV